MTEIILNDGWFGRGTRLVPLRDERNVLNLVITIEHEDDLGMTELALEQALRELQSFRASYPLQRNES